MSVKIYGHPWSINTRKSLLTLAEKGHEAELALVMLPLGEHKQPAHVARHPWGKVPVLEHEGFVVYESRAIGRYLDDALAGPLLTPAAPRERARAEQWMNVSDLYFSPHAGALLMESLFRDYLGGGRNEAAITSGRAQIQAPLDALDKHLADHAFIAGDAFSLADIHWMPYLEYLFRLEPREAQRAHLARWWASVSERPTWTKVGRTGPQPYDPAVRASVLEQLRAARPAA
jgi:glutathione S-transferase